MKESDRGKEPGVEAENTAQEEIPETMLENEAEVGAEAENVILEAGFNIMKEEEVGKEIEKEVEKEIEKEAEKEIEKEIRHIQKTKKQKKIEDEPFDLSQNSFNESFVSQNGLIPKLCALTPEEEPYVLLLFRMMGSFSAIALVDNRIFPLDLHPIFFCYVLNKKITLEHDIVSVDKFVGKLLRDIIATKWNKQIDLALFKNSVLLDGEPSPSIYDSFIDFTLPFPLEEVVELKENGKDIFLSLENTDEYLHLVTKCFCSLVEKRLRAFADGFFDVIPQMILKKFGFSGEELKNLICGISIIEWDREALQEHIVCKQPLSHETKVVKDFIEVLCEMEMDERKKFLSFLTATPRLPLGGLSSLSPKLTLVQRVDDSVPANQQLPSTHSCTNELKLPLYSTKEILSSKLKLAIEESTGFDLD